MVVALEESLGHLQFYLQEAGYKVVPLYRKTSGVDAVVYQHSHIEDLPAFPQQYSGGQSGVLMIYGGGLTPEQVINILKQRNYGGMGILEF